MRKIGLVLSGGGAKGAYQIGVMKAIEEYGLVQQISAISGSSIGALNACLFLQYPDENRSYIWRHLKWDYVLQLEECDYKRLMNLQQKIAATPLSKLKVASEALGIARQIGLPLPRQHFSSALNHFIDYDTVRHAPIPCYIGCENMQRNWVHYFKLNLQSDEMIHDVLLASTAIPMVYKPVQIGSGLYCDPMRYENVPLRPLLYEDCDIIIIVNLDVTAVQKIPRIRHMNQKTLVTISPSRLISPTLQGSFDFSDQTIQEHLMLGYEDAMSILKQVFSEDLSENMY